MFKLDQTETYWYPVEIELTDKDGKKKKFDFDAEFERLPDDEFKDLFRPRDEGDEPLKDDDVVKRVFRGWRKIKDADDTDLEVTDSNREKLLNVYGVKRRIVKAFLKSVGIEGKTKN